MINVLNKYKLNGHEDNIIYIGRPSVLGNPFSHLEGTKAQYKVQSRDEAVDKYEDWLRSKLNIDKNLTKEMLNLYKIAKGGDLNLVCWCSPKRCHGDVIKKIIEEKMAKQL